MAEAPNTASHSCRFSPGGICEIRSHSPAASLPERRVCRPQIPDEYLDELTAEIMSDPVLLPSGKVVDRTTITRHLLSNETDPFSRQKLTVDQLVDAPEIKAKIQEYRAAKRAEKAAAAKGEAPMEVEP